MGVDVAAGGWGCGVDRRVGGGGQGGRLAAEQPAETTDGQLAGLGHLVERSELDVRWVAWWLVGQCENV